MFTIDSGELSCTIKIKQHRKSGQEVRAEQPPEGTFLKVSRILFQLSLTLKAMLSPRGVYLTPLLSELISYPPPSLTPLHPL